MHFNRQTRQFLRLSLAALGCLGWIACPVAAAGTAPYLSPLAPAPDWSQLEAYQETITRAEFRHWLDTHYAPGNAWDQTIQIDASGAEIVKDFRIPRETFRLRFAPSPDRRRPAPRYWKSGSELGRAPPGKPLAGLTIAIDPGHIGGDFARMEERWFQIGTARPVIEGDMVLVVARHLEPRLQALGAKVVHVRRDNRPVTRQRPQDLRDEGRALLRDRGVINPPETYSTMLDPRRAHSVQWQSELLFFRNSEVRARAALINRRLKPDLTLCLHFNAESWGNPDRPSLVDASHFHILVNGAHMKEELALDDVRFDALMRLLQGIHHVEIPAATDVATVMAERTGLPPFIYRGPHAVAVPGSDFVWGRNLLAGRTFMNPVLFLEPYVMNSKEDHARIQAGDYAGERMVAGRMQSSIFREYADALSEGLAFHFSRVRR